MLHATTQHIWDATKFQLQPEITAVLHLFANALHNNLMQLALQTQRQQLATTASCRKPEPNPV